MPMCEYCAELPQITLDVPEIFAGFTPSFGLSKNLVSCGIDLSVDRIHIGFQSFASQVPSFLSRVQQH